MVKAKGGRPTIDRQDIFVCEYLKDLNATRAAIAAGYSKKTAYSIGGRLLKNVEIKEKIEKAKEKRADRAKIDADRVIQELARIGLSDMRKVVKWGGEDVYAFDSDELDDDSAACVSEISRTKDGLKIKLHSKPQALALLIEHLPKKQTRDAIKSLRLRLTKGSGDGNRTDGKGFEPEPNQVS